MNVRVSSANHAALNSTAPCIQRSLGDHTVSHCTDLCDTAHSLFKHYGMYEFAFHGERSINRMVLDFPIGLPQAPAPLDEAVSTADWLVNNPPPVNADAETAAADDSDSSVSSLNDAVPSSHTRALLDSLGHMYTGSACWLSCVIPVSLTKSLHCHFLLCHSRPSARLRDRRPTRIAHSSRLLHILRSLVLSFSHRNEDQHRNAMHTTLLVLLHSYSILHHMDVAQECLRGHVEHARPACRRHLGPRD